MNAKLAGYGLGLLALVALGSAPAQALGATCDEAAAAADDAPEMLLGCGAVSPQAGPRQAGKNAVEELEPMLEIDAAELEIVDVSRSIANDYVRFQQELDGIPVLNGQVVVGLSPGNRVRTVTSSATSADLDDRSAALSSADAVKLAVAGAAPGAIQRSLPDVELVAYPADGEAILAWHVVAPTASPAADWNIVLDADSGVVLARWDGLLEVDGTGLVFSPNPIQDTGNTALVDAGDGNSAALDAARSNVTLTNLGAGNKLIGDFADLAGTGIAGSTLPYTPGTADEPTRVYNYQRSDDRFEEASVYHAITETQKLIQSLGFSDVNNRSIPIDVHYFPDDQSFYSGTNGGLHFGDGGVDDAEDSDIVIHEYGHSIHHNQVPGWGGGGINEQRAIGEGFGDLLAVMAYYGTGDPVFEATDRKYCVGEWDAVSYNPIGASPGSGCLRWVNGRSEGNGADVGTYSGIPTQVHSDGRYWSAAMTCVFEGLGANTAARDDVLQLVIESHEALVPDTSLAGFDNQIAAMLAADQALNAGANVTLIRNCALGRGLVQAPAAPVITGTSPASGGNENAPEVQGTQSGTGFPTQIKIYGNAACSGAPDVTGTVAQFTGGGITISVPDNSVTTLSARASGAGGDSACSNSINYAEVTPGGGSGDTTRPETTITKGPKKKSKKRSATFEFSSNESGSTFACSLNGAPFASCSSPAKANGKKGKNTFEVRATDPAKNTDATPAAYSWKVKKKRR